MPPPAPVAVLPVTLVRLRVSTLRFAMAPPLVLFPPVRVKPWSVRFPFGASTSKMRNGVLVELLAIVVPNPLMVTWLVIAGNPATPPIIGIGVVVAGAVRVYVHPGARLIVPPATFAALMAATSPAAPLEHGTNAAGVAEATAAGVTAKARSSAPVPIAIVASLIVFIVPPPWSPCWMPSPTLLTQGFPTAPHQN